MKLDIVTKTAVNDGVLVMALLTGMLFVVLGSVAAMMWAAGRGLDFEMRGILAGAFFNLVLALIFALLWGMIP